MSNYLDEVCTLSTTRCADKARIDMLGLLLEAADSDAILDERPVRNGSGRCVGWEYDVTRRTLIALDRAIHEQTLTTTPEKKENDND